MAFGFPAKARGEVRFDLPHEELVEAVRDTLQVLSWPYEEGGAGSFRAKVSMGLLSYGERLEIDAGADGTVHVLSRCVWPLQCIDWGKNAANVDKFLGGLKQMLS